MQAARAVRNEMKSIAERLSAKVGARTKAGCMEWQGTVGSTGYGLIRIGPAKAGKAGVHRVAYELANGPIPDGMDVCHRCDNRRCCNPEHLFLGTRKDNVADMVAKNRHAWRNPPPWTKLSDVDVSDILVLRSFGMSRKAIAREYGVSRPLISMLVSGSLKRYERPLLNI